jgi:hypothetical protein
MKINEITNTLKTYIVVIKLRNGSTAKTTIQAENANHARLLLQNMHGKNSVLSINEVSAFTNENTKVLSASELQVKTLADKSKELNQQAKQLKARQSLTKAQAQLRKANAMND